MKNQNGYTLIELLVALGIIVQIIILGLLAWVAIHFILKFW